MQIASGERIELTGAGKRRFSVGYQSSTRVFMCRYEDEPYLRPKLGEVHPLYSWLVCVDVDCDDLPGEDPDTGDTQNVRITATYEARVRRDLPIRTMDISAEGLDTTGLGTWVDNGEACDIPITEYHSRASWTYEFTTWQVPFATILAITDCVNSLAFEGLPAGTVLFGGASSRTEYDDEGRPGERVSLRFTYNPDGWNYILRASDGLWVRRNPDLYRSADFSVLF